MSGFLALGAIGAGMLVGALVATVVAVLVARTRLRTVACPDPERHRLTDAEETSVAAEFAAHSMRVHEQLSTYADFLAEGDPELRERLRVFETGLSR